jgi:hypothetical protein
MSLKYKKILQPASIVGNHFCKSQEKGRNCFVLNNAAWLGGKGIGIR